MKFYDRDWGFRSSKADLISQPIPAITGIDGEVPHNGFTLFDIPVASKNKSLSSMADWECCDGAYCENLSDDDERGICLQFRFNEPKEPAPGPEL